MSRDGTSDYFINGIKVRRKDITQLFLGTGLGTRSYAIIEQGMISRVIEARPDDLRAFLEEAAGISRYKERRRETENRIGHTRENLDRLNDLREEVEKQIRHLQRQAATARRYQALKEEERKLQAELLACACRAWTRRRQVRDAATSSCETAMQAVLADLREVEAEIERIRADQTSKADALGAIQTRFYEAGAEVTRIEQGIQFTRELRQRQRSDLEQAEAQVADLTGVLQRDRGQLEALSQELATMVPGLDAAHAAGDAHLASFGEPASRRWRRGSRPGTPMRRPWRTASGRPGWNARASSSWRASSAGCCSSRSARRASARRSSELQPAVALETLEPSAESARDAGQKAAAELQELLAEISVTRDREREQSQALNALRTRWQQALGTQVSTEALQTGGARQGLRQGHRVAEVEVAGPAAARRAAVARRSRLGAGGRNRAGILPRGGVRRRPGQRHGSARRASTAAILAVVSMERRGRSARGRAMSASLQAKVQGATVLGSVLSSVYTAETLNEALGRRRRLAAGESVVTRDGIWLGSDWLRISRDADPHTGVIEREESSARDPHAGERARRGGQGTGTSPGADPRARARS